MKNLKKKFNQYLTDIKEAFTSPAFTDFVPAGRQLTKEDMKMTLSVKELAALDDTAALENYQEIIRELAYAKWEEAGRPLGDGTEFWVAAEQELFGFDEDNYFDDFPETQDSK